METKFIPKPHLARRLKEEAEAAKKDPTNGVGLSLEASDISSGWYNRASDDDGIIAAKEAERAKAAAQLPKSRKAYKPLEAPMQVLKGQTDGIHLGPSPKYGPKQVRINGVWVRVWEPGDYEYNEAVYFDGSVYYSKTAHCKDEKWAAGLSPHNPNLWSSFDSATRKQDPGPCPPAPVVKRTRKVIGDKVVVVQVGQQVGKSTAMASVADEACRHFLLSQLRSLRSQEKQVLASLKALPPPSHR